MTASSSDRPGLRQATGRDYDEWFALLDAWGAPGRPYREIADWLVGEHGFSKWWAQKVIVEYEQSRGLRPPGVRPDGTFTVGTSKTIPASTDQLYAAFTDPTVRSRWLPGVDLAERTTRPGRSARFDWPSDGTRLSVELTSRGPDKTSVSIEHERLPTPESATARKSYWKDRLIDLARLFDS